MSLCVRCSVCMSLVYVPSCMSPVCMSPLSLRVYVFLCTSLRVYVHVPYVYVPCVYVPCVCPLCVCPLCMSPLCASVRVCLSVYGAPCVCPLGMSLCICPLCMSLSVCPLCITPRVSPLCVCPHCVRRSVYMSLCNVGCSVCMSLVYVFVYVPCVCPLCMSPLCTFAPCMYVAPCISLCVYLAPCVCMMSFVCKTICIYIPYVLFMSPYKYYNVTNKLADFGSTTNLILLSYEFPAGCQCSKKGCQPSSSLSLNLQIAQGFQHELRRFVSKTRVWQQFRSIIPPGSFLLSSAHVVANEQDVLKGASCICLSTLAIVTWLALS